MCAAPTKGRGQDIRRRSAHLLIPRTRGARENGNLHVIHRGVYHDERVPASLVDADTYGKFSPLS